MNDLITLNDVVGECIQQSIDFEILHGTTTTKIPSIRRQMVITPLRSPAVLIKFGDKAHGERISTVTVEGNPNLSVTSDELLNLIRTSNSAQAWSASRLNNLSATADTSLTVLDKNTRTVLVTGAPVKKIDGEKGLFTYVFILETPYTVVSSQEVYVSRSEITVQSETELTVGERIAVKGVYSYPSTVKV